MSELHRIEDQIKAALRTIRDLWAALHVQPYSSGAGKGSPSSDVVNGLDRRVSLAHEVTMTLNGWCRVVVEDFDVEHHIPLGTDTLGMVTFLERWAQMLSGHEAAQDVADELAKAASDVRRTALPPRKDWIKIGMCPNTIGIEGESVTCGQEVRVTTAYQGTIRCRGCGIEDTMDGWILRIVGTEGLVTIPQLVPLLRKRMGISVSERTLRRWHREHRIASSGGTETTPLFDRRHVFTSLTAREHHEATRRDT